MTLMLRLRAGQHNAPDQMLASSGCAAIYSSTVLNLDLAIVISVQYLHRAANRPVAAAMSISAISSPGLP